MLNLKAVYEQYQAEVFGYLYSLTHDTSLSEELTADTFLAALIGLPGFRGDADIKTWLFGIARRKWYAYLKKEHKNLSLEELSPKECESDLSLANQVERTEEARRALALLENEDARTKEVFHLRLQGFSYREIAGKTGISESSARIIDFRCKKKIREQLTKEGITNG